MGARLNKNQEDKEKEETHDKYSIAHSTGVAWPADTKVGGDFHGGYSYTHTWLPQVNLFDLIRRFLK